MGDGIVFIAEDSDPDDMFMLSGRFSAHWESDDGKHFREGPEQVSAEEAIAWGRTQTDVVQIRVGEEDFYYSAGVRQPENEELPEWPQGGILLARRRAPSMAYLDRTADDPPITWEVRISADLPAERLQRPRFVERLSGAVAADPNSSDLEIPDERIDDEEPTLLASFLVQARTWDEANTLADAIRESARESARKSAFETAEPELGGAGERLIWVETEVVPAPGSRG